MLLVGRVKNPEPRTSDFSTDLLLTTAVLKSGSDCTKIEILDGTDEKQSFPVASTRESSEYCGSHKNDDALSLLHFYGPCDSIGVVNV